jgi:hypothetical protein
VLIVRATQARRRAIVAAPGRRAGASGFVESRAQR